jgi:HSP20 family molecular chaperone IbpA
MRPLRRKGEHMHNTKKSLGSQIYINQILDDVSSFFGDVITTAAKTYTLGTGSSQPSMWIWNDSSWTDFMNRDFSVPCQIPTYPVSNYSVLKDGSSLIEVAVTGFADDELTVEKNGSKIIVRGKRYKQEQKDSQKKYMYRNIACRDFELEFQGADSWDYSKIEADIDRGILSIKIPLTAESKPLEIQINKKK